MKFFHLLILLSLFLIPKISRGDTCTAGTGLTGDTLIITVDAAAYGEDALLCEKRPNPVLQVFRKKQNKNRKLIAAALAFPFPFGIVGLHRIYLGCAPYVPVAYIASLGGIFGVLPFIDFCVLIVARDTESYINNKKVFMWVR